MKNNGIGSTIQKEHCKCRCSYEELEAVSVSEKLSQLEDTEANESPQNDEDNVNATSADGQVVLSDGTHVKDDSKLLGNH